MLTPTYLAKFSASYLAMVDSLNEQIVRDIARRIVKTGVVTETAEWQSGIVLESGVLLEDIAKDVSKFSGYSEKEILRLYKEAGIVSIRNDAEPLVRAGLAKNPSLSDQQRFVLLANAHKTAGDAYNLTRTTASKGQDAYYRYANEAFLQVQSGAFSPQEALRRAIKNAAKEGAVVRYDSGAKDKLDVALRRSLLTGLNQTTAKLTEMYSQDMGATHYETTAHFGARLEHVPWQGRVFLIEGSDSDYENFYEATGYGTGEGLCGWNCRHSFHPFFVGLSKPAYSEDQLVNYRDKTVEYNGKTYTEYQASQKMRGYERNIRESKRILVGYDAAITNAEDEVTENAMREAFRNEAVRLKRMEKAYADFCHKTGHDTDDARTQVHAVLDGKGDVLSYNRSVSMKAVWANRKALA